MATFMLTASSQVKSANTESDIANHSGKANRKKFAHKNSLINKDRSDWNVEFDVHSRRELLEAHYAKRLENRKKHNRSKDRSWDSLDDFLDTFEGKKARKDSKNERWATQSQVTYVGDKDTMKAIWKTFTDAGVAEEDVRAAYSAGYEEYIAKHNEAFPTLPIYHSDVHFDEATPHGHDAIVVMGHTPKGMASESFNNALGELYGYQDKKQGKSENMQRYREENDNLAYESITGALQALAQERGIVMDFELIRTGQDSSVSTETYKREKDLDDRQVELDEREMKLSGREAELEERISGIEDRESALAQQEADFTGREARAKEKADEVRKREDELNHALYLERQKGITNTLQLYRYLNPETKVSVARRIIDINLVYKFSHKVEELSVDDDASIANVAVPILNEKIAEVFPPQTKKTQAKEDNDGPEL